MLNIANAQISFAGALEHFQSELKKLRVGRPNPDMFANVEVEAYGSRQKLHTVASVSVVDASLVTVQAWDKSLLPAIVKALQLPPLNYNPQINGDLVRIPIPVMTQEKRLEAVKLLKESAEQARIQIRVIRKDVLMYLDNQKKEVSMPEDTYTAETKRLQAMVDDTNKQIETISLAKEQSLMSV